MPLVEDDGTARRLDLCKGLSAGMSWRSRKSAASIATTSEAH